MINIFRLSCLGLLLVLSGCTKKDKDYESFLKGGEIIYPGLISHTGFRTGNLRTQLQWSPSPDPNVKSYAIYWNNGLDSLLVPSASNDPRDTASVLITGLKEYVYSFIVYSLYAKSNSRSVPTTINNVKVYGPVYQGGLLNRAINADNPYEFNSSGYLTLHFNKPDTINTGTVIRYTDLLGNGRDTILAPDSNSIVLPDYKTGTKIRYQSSYIPLRGSIDTFTVTQADDFPTVLSPVLCDKSLFQPMHLANDVSDAYGWVLQNLWDGSTNEPGFHTPGQDFPIFFTFDMGAPYTLYSFRLWQRTSGLFNYGNPKRFEVWGSSTTPDPSGDWSSWTQLATFTSHKPSGLPVGQNTAEDAAYDAAGEPFIFPTGLAPVRYLRFKILETWGSTNYFHALELSFYNVNP